MAALSLGLQLAFRVLGLLILARVLGPSGQGTVALAYLAASVGSTVAAVGLDVALLRSAARGDSRNAARAAVWTQSIVTTLACVALVALVELIASPSASVVVGIAAVPGLLFARLAASCALGEGRVWSFGVATVLPWALTAVGIVAIAAVGELSIDYALASFAVSSAMAGALLAIGFASWLRPTFRPRLWASDPYRDGVRVFPGLLAQFANYRLDQVVIAVTLTRSDLGLYSLAVAASEAGMLPAQATANAVLPRASRTQGGSDRRFWRAIVLSSLLVLVVVPPFVALTHLGLPAYEDALIPFLLLLPGTAALAASKIMAAVVVGRGEAWRASRIAFVTLGITAVATIALIPTLGLVGAGLAASISYCASAWLLLRAMTKPSLVNGRSA